MPVRIVEDPVGDPRWSDLLERHPNASVFHLPGWLKALRQTYGYQPFVVTTSTGPTLENGLVVCRVKGLMSGRLVSLPFSDHCNPLVDGSEPLSEMLLHITRETQTAGWRSVELRPGSEPGHRFEEAAHECGLKQSATYFLHRLNLRPDATEIFRRFHHSSTQRVIRRAEREGLTHEVGTSDRLLGSFYHLMRMTRRRHGLPPQPLMWFRNLVACLGDRVAVHVASKDARPIASILTVSFRNTMLYKYGGSEAAHHRLGGMPFLFWRLIQHARARGFVELDLGRTDVDQPGLIAFKEHLGADRSTINYYSSSAGRGDAWRRGWLPKVGRGVLARLPDSALDLVGRLVYKHLG